VNHANKTSRIDHFRVAQSGENDIGSNSPERSIRKLKTNTRSVFPRQQSRRAAATHFGLRQLRLVLPGGNAFDRSVGPAGLDRLDQQRKWSRTSAHRSAHRCFHPGLVGTPWLPSYRPGARARLSARTPPYSRRQPPQGGSHVRITASRTRQINTATTSAQSFRQ